MAVSTAASTCSSMFSESSSISGCGMRRLSALSFSWAKASFSALAYASAMLSLLCFLLSNGKYCCKTPLQPGFMCTVSFKESVASFKPLVEVLLRRFSSIWSMLAFSSAKSYLHLRLLVPGIKSAFSCSSMSKHLFISVWKCSKGKSLASSPKGFSSSTPMKFNDANPNMGTKLKIGAQNLLRVKQTIKKGIRKMLRKSIMLMSCANGKGKRVSAIFFAFNRFTKPRDNVW
mmetsp:Transcript_35598/g.83223  ORF Transcript_35598/g.83223 Transcript_35598/m.83223 type:complete len:231 (+) Transcript_35598:296-988(+)